MNTATLSPGLMVVRPDADADAPPVKETDMAAVPPVKAPVAAAAAAKPKAKPQRS